MLTGLGPIANGTAGWSDDGGTFADMGDRSNDGNSLVRVTLFRGRSPIDTQDQTAAQGQPILCRILEGVSFPPRGASVLVAIPEPGGLTPGNPVIIGVINSTPSKNANAGPGDKVITAASGVARFAVLGNGTICAVTSDDNTADGNSVYLKVSPTALQFVAPWGTLNFDATGFRVRHHSGASLSLGGITMPAIGGFSLGSYANLTAANVYCNGTVVWLGPSDDPATVWQSGTWTPQAPPGPALLTCVASACVRFSVP